MVFRTIENVVTMQGQAYKGHKAAVSFNQMLDL